MKAVYIGDQHGDVFEVAEVRPSACSCAIVRLVFIGFDSTMTFCNCKSYRGEWNAAMYRPLLGSEQEALDAIEEEVKETELIPMEA